ncbi:hypothetical protein GQ54DRAFT_117529 [Martensiomyces pterosporus]|nr:hypothetical protein GQ54DRAFT_117529 [Martensiomyces pterosporus]
MSRGRGRGRGEGGARREMSALQTELLGKSIFSKNEDDTNGYPEYEMPISKPPTEEERHIAQLLGQFQAELRASVFCLQQPAPPKEIERYSDRYFKAGQNGTSKGSRSLKGLKTNAALFPEELHSAILKKKTKKTRSEVDNRDGLLEALEGAKDEDEDEDEEKKGEDEEVAEEEIEEEDEEENDYMDSYFDNGEADDMGDMDDDEGGGGDYY